VFFSLAITKEKGRSCYRRHQRGSRAWVRREKPFYSRSFEAAKIFKEKAHACPGETGKGSPPGRSMDVAKHPGVHRCNIHWVVKERDRREAIRKTSLVTNREKPSGTELPKKVHGAECHGAVHVQNFLEKSTEGTPWPRSYTPKGLGEERVGPEKSLKSVFRVGKTWWVSVGAWGGRGKNSYGDAKRAAPNIRRYLQVITKTGGGPQ